MKIKIPVFMTNPGGYETTWMELGDPYGLSN